MNLIFNQGRNDEIKGDLNVQDNIEDKLEKNDYGSDSEIDSFNFNDDTKQLYRHAKYPKRSGFPKSARYIRVGK